MADQVSLFPLAASRVLAGGRPIVALYGPILGGVITNPQTADGQRIPAVEILYLDIVNPATLGESPTTIPLQPGQSFVVPPGQTTNVWVNAATTGHRFSGYAIQPPVPFPPAPQPGPFPPAGPTTVLETIPSYLYQQYTDDDDLQAFVRAYNDFAQEYVDWFNGIDLPVYTAPQIFGPLLDWVVEGLYGEVRPVLSSGKNRDLGPLNTYAYNVLPLNVRRRIGPQNVTATSDDVFKRIVTWNFWKGDGKVFDIRWLKRRIMRFLLGADGAAPNVDQTYQVSVTFGVGNQVNIRLISGVRTVTGGALLNRFAMNTMPFNALRTSFRSVDPLPNAAVLKEAIESGVLQLPFQFTYVVTV